MKCPNCGFEQPEDSATCPVCGLIFAKWRERHGETTPPAESPGPAAVTAPGPEKSFKPNLLFLLAAVVAVIAVGGLFLCQDRPPKEKPASTTPVPAIPTALEVISQAVTESRQTGSLDEEPTPAAFTGDPWKFQGTIIDILHLTPVSGLTIVFEYAGSNLTAVTDSQGKYLIELPPLPDGKGYFAYLSHPDFGDRYWEGDWSKYTRSQRISVRGQVPFHGSCKGSTSSAANYDFAMYPEKLTEEEEREWYDTIAPPAKD